MCSSTGGAGGGGLQGGPRQPGSLTRAGEPALHRAAGRKAAGARRKPVDAVTASFGLFGSRTGEAVLRASFARKQAVQAEQARDVATFSQAVTKVLAGQLRVELQSAKRQVRSASL